MNRENKLFKFAIFVLALSMIGFILVSGTYAKYTSEFSGSDTAVVARWDVRSTHTTTTADIFAVSQIYDTNGATYTTGTPTDDTNVANGSGENAKGIIAPGTWGKFSYELTNSSQVTATYAVDYTVNEAGVYLQWSTDGTTWSDNLSNINATNMPIGGASVTNTVYWRWAFEGGNTPIASGQTDANDTNLGETQELAQPTITVNVTFTQVD